MKKVDYVKQLEAQFKRLSSHNEYVVWCEFLDSVKEMAETITKLEVKISNLEKPAKKVVSEPYIVNVSTESKSSKLKVKSTEKE